MSEPKQWLTRVEADVAFLRLSAPEAVAAIENELRASLRAQVEALGDDCHDREGLLCTRDEQGRCTPVARADVLALIATTPPTDT